jgi:hypothetical protein
MKFVDEETKNFRLQQCDSCEKRSSIGGICLACNCFIKAKVKFKAALCPLHKWGEEGDLPSEDVLEQIRNDAKL